MIGEHTPGAEAPFLGWPSRAKAEALAYPEARATTTATTARATATATATTTATTTATARATATATTTATTTATATARATATATATAKYRGFSAALRSGRDDVRLAQGGDIGGFVEVRAADVILGIWSHQCQSGGCGSRAEGRLLFEPCCCSVWCGCRSL